jgi:uncharacterized membrane protein YeaQ/YmgE (transglycosylase-associated protein family)
MIIGIIGSFLANITANLLVTIFKIFLFVPEVPGKIS